MNGSDILMLLFCEQTEPVSEVDPCLTDKQIQTGKVGGAASCFSEASPHLK